METSNYTNKERMRSYSSIFSRSLFTDIVKYDDYKTLNAYIKRYDSARTFLTYSDYIKYTYKLIAKDYRCEYVYKNEILNQFLIKQFGTKDTIAINEFRVNNSIVDLALFNGVSRAYEIKTEYDNKKRLTQQLEDYSKFFQKCYLVIPEESYKRYDTILPENVGVVVMKKGKGRIQLEEEKKAIDNDEIDVKILMHSLRIKEYKGIVKAFFGELPNVSCFEMFDRCEELISKIPQQCLRDLVLTEVKKRKNNTQLLRTLPQEIRQMCLALNINQTQSKHLLMKLNYKIV